MPGVAPGRSVQVSHRIDRTRATRSIRADPFAFRCEVPPRTASVVWDLSYEWGDDEWMQNRARSAMRSMRPQSVYELHVGSWRRVPEEHNRSLNYRELAHAVSDYVIEMGFTHVELMPIMEHPFYGSWGYQVTGYFAPTSRYGTPQDFMYFVDYLHRRGIGVILDWVPVAFSVRRARPGLLRRHASLRARRSRARAFTRSGTARSSTTAAPKSATSSAAARCSGSRSITSTDCAWMPSPRCCISTTRRKAGEWIPNQYRRPRESRCGRVSEAAQPRGVPRPSRHPDHRRGIDGLADGLAARPTWAAWASAEKWNMGWMHDTLKYFQTDPMFRKYQHNSLTFSIWYAFTENFVLPISHDEVVHGKGSLIGKMPGDEWQQFANLRLLLGYMWTHPGKKLLFMGCEFGQVREWTHDCEPGVARAAVPAARGRAALDARPEPLLQADALAVGVGLLGRRLPVDRLQQRRRQRVGLPAQRQAARRLHAGGAATSRPCRATTTRSACRAAAPGASGSTAMRRTTGAAASATSVRSRRRPCRRMATFIR